MLHGIRAYAGFTVSSRVEVISGEAEPETNRLGFGVPYFNTFFLKEPS